MSGAEADGGTSGQSGKPRAERRREPRRPCRLSVRLRRLATPGLWEADDPVFFSALITNVSPSGLCLETDLHMSPGQRLQLELNDPYGPGRFTGNLQVARIARVTGEGVVFEFQVGLRGESQVLRDLWARLG